MKLITLKNSIFCIALLASSLVYAQLELKNEYPIKYYTLPDVKLLNNHDLVIHYKTNIYYKFEILNKNLEAKKVVSFPNRGLLKNKSYFYNYSENSNKVFFFDSRKKVTFFDLNGENLTFLDFKFNHFLNSINPKIINCGDNYFAISYKRWPLISTIVNKVKKRQNTSSNIVSVNLETGNVTKMITSKKFNKRIILDLDTINRNLFYIKYLHYKGLKKRDNYFNFAFLDNHGRIVNDKVISKNYKNYKYSNEAIHQIHDTSMVFSSKYVYEKGLKQEVGVMYMRLDNYKFKSINYININKFQKLNDYVKQLKESKRPRVIVAGIGNTKFFSGYEYNCHKPIVLENGHLLIVIEVSYIYNDIENNVKTVGGKQSVTLEQIVVGYKKLGALFIELNSSSEMVFDDFIPIDNKIIYKTDIKLLKQNENSAEPEFVLFNNNTLMKYQYSDRSVDLVSSIDVKSNIKSSSKSDEISNTIYNLWYDNYYLNFDYKIKKVFRSKKITDMKLRKFELIVK